MTTSYGFPSQILQNGALIYGGGGGGYSHPGALEFLGAATYIDRHGVVLACSSQL
eukprot:SAG22_NODE_16_length_32723_cov_26.404825_19_plen_55_part_00